MVIVMHGQATGEQVDRVVAAVMEQGFDAHRSTGASHTVIGVVGEAVARLDPREFALMDGVHEVLRVSEPYKLAGRAFHPDDTVVSVGDVQVGGERITLMAGPCAVENAEQMEAVAASVARSGAAILRGGAFKPRTSPYSFQGLGPEGLKLLRAAADRHGLKVISEVVDRGDLPLMSDSVDILQVGARNMQNYRFLKDLGKVSRPVLLKRGMSATLEELLLAAEYIMDAGNSQVILCERGIRTFETATRNTMDISAIPILKKRSHLPVVADPSHGTGLRDKVLPMARAAVAAGADGLLIEVHNDPEHALSDGPQSIYPEQFAELCGQLKVIAPAIGRRL